jgi:hypothetical protein
VRSRSTFRTNHSDRVVRIPLFTTQSRARKGAKKNQIYFFDDSTRSLPTNITAFRRACWFTQTRRECAFRTNAIKIANTNVEGTRVAIGPACVAVPRVFRAPMPAQFHFPIHARSSLTIMHSTTARNVVEMNRLRKLNRQGAAILKTMSSAPSQRLRLPPFNDKLYRLLRSCGRQDVKKLGRCHSVGGQCTNCRE